MKQKPFYEYCHRCEHYVSFVEHTDTYTEACLSKPAFDNEGFCTNWKLKIMTKEQLNALVDHTRKS